MDESDKHSSLLQYGINYSCKKYYDSGPRNPIYYRYAVMALSRISGPSTNPEKIRWSELDQVPQVQHDDTQHNDIQGPVS